MTIKEICKKVTKKYNFNVGGLTTEVYVICGCNLLFDFYDRIPDNEDNDNSMGTQR